jgi:O-antigen ligase
LYLIKHQTLIANKKLVKVVLFGYIALAFLTSMGTYARTGLVSMGVLGALLLAQGRNRFRNFSLVAIAIVFLLGISSDQWMNRMSTIGDGTEGSAMGRVAVWLWTAEYVMSNPLGGSFESYRINEKSMLLADGSTLVVDSKAFHSIYFEILGETGFPGLIIFSILVFMTYRNFKPSNVNEGIAVDSWRNDIGIRLRQTLLVFLAGGAFIGIGFQSYFYYLAAISVALVNMDAKKVKHA